MKNFLVLGGSGNLGSALKKNRFFSKYSHFPLKKDLDILSLKKFLSFIKKKNIKLIINCAAVARMRECEKNRLKAFDTNVFGTLNLLKSINKIDENIKLVHISSDAVYPCKKGNYSEQSKLQPYNFYGYTKLLSEKIILNSKNYMIIRTRFFDKNKILFSHSATDKNFNGIINVGGKKISDYNLYKKFKKEIKKCKQSDIQKELEFQISKDASMNCKLLKNVLNDKK